MLEEYVRDSIIFRHTKLLQQVGLPTNSQYSQLWRGGADETLVAEHFLLWSKQRDLQLSTWPYPKWPKPILRMFKVLNKKITGEYSSYSGNLSQGVDLN